MTTTNRTIAILGMHRSGTSALTGSLEQAGMYIGETNQQSEDNLKGNRESRAIMTLHDDLLARNGGAWDQPPVRNMKWNPVHRVLMRSIIQNFEAEPVWGFKDPRTLLAVNLWLKTIPTLELVGIFRHPFLVADSLIRRNGMSPDTALNLWIIYNRKLAWLAQNKGPFPLLEFSADPEDFNDQLQSLVTSLKLPTTPLNFFDANLRQQSIPHMPPSAIAKRSIAFYESLKEVRTEAISTQRAAA